MKARTILPVIFFVMIVTACEDRAPGNPVAPLPESTTKITGQSVIKILPSSTGWVALKEILQTQLKITQPKREISWLTGDFHETSNYKSDESWSVIDAVVHPSGEVSAVTISLDLTDGINYTWHIKMVRFKTDGSIVESELSQLPVTSLIPAYPLTYDRAKLIAFGEDVYVVARWKHNIIEAYRLSFGNNEFKVDWQKLVETGHFVGGIGIIGGGFDNFHQGDRDAFVYGGVDSQGNLYVAAPSSGDLLISHDQQFGDNLLSQADPGAYDYGVAVLTKFSSAGERLFSKLEGHSPLKRLINMRVSDNGVYLVGRVKTGTNPNSWDAWVFAADVATGNQLYESTVDIRDGDMFWDLEPLAGGGAIAVGTTDYVQNPVGLSVSDSRKAAAVVLDAQGKMVQEIELPQGPVERGSEAMFAKVLGNGSVVFAGAHNAPGTHAAIYSDGFIAVRNFPSRQ